ncbi:protein-L-isoaspartate O-methyltransferase [Psychromarinibacter sp. C21-152]|uniref:Protein-L-isoaspartate O-methyltransferase n=1 Tax=Psychromarinibacter sediminicola TaxID=3033385 RepID=A0AAE3NPZ7_9RHOB|nr:protein-L-isoaspartate O-methyltransferase [Psychromarinibacter sediminicola]MDF0599922.1 protein-L-isoaspartate O-methyltransferase [Psychromarinibacter sediminicola]
MTDNAARRRMMVDTQVRPSDVTKYPIIEAMLEVPRERFVPDDWRPTAYVDGNIPLAPGRCVLAPRTLAKLLDALNIRPDELVLDLGCGLGYSAAVMARLAEAVVALEEDADMAAEAQAQLSEDGADNVAVVEAPLTAGAPKHGPYDAILVEGAVEEIPEALTDQLKDGGRIGLIVMQGALGQARIGVKADGVMSWRWIFDGGAPVLPGFERKAEFVL